MKIKEMKRRQVNRQLVSLARIHNVEKNEL